MASGFDVWEDPQRALRPIDLRDLYQDDIAKYCKDLLQRSVNRIRSYTYHTVSH